MKRLVILKTGTTIPEIGARRGDFEHWITQRMAVVHEEALVVEVHRGQSLPDPEDASAVVVTGSAAMVTARAGWSVDSGEWLATVVGRAQPVLAICYGHQLVADVHGGLVGRNPRGREIGTIDVRLSDAARRDPLFGALPPAPRFQATHLEAVLSLPDDARHLAESDLDDNQAYRMGERAWCVQFHPECDADVIRGYIAARRADITAEGLDPDRLIAEAEDTAHGPALLHRFAELSGLHDRG